MRKNLTAVMKTYIWPAPLYSFLNYVTKKVDDSSTGKKILDCGAGGKHPPLALFKRHGFKTYGIDISAEQIKKAKEFAADQGMELDIRKADMRNIPFPSECFDFVYEFFSMSHMIKKEVAVTIEEITRVLKKGGYCFLGFILHDTWPLMGRERKKGSGEYWRKDDRKKVVHSVFAEEETENYLSGLEIMKKELWRGSDVERIMNVTWDEWLKLWDTGDSPREEKRKRYEMRNKLIRYTHLFYILRKPT